MDTIETGKINGYTWEISSDPYVENPRLDMDHDNTMVCFNRKYDLGDKQLTDPRDLGKEHAFATFICEVEGLEYEYSDWGLSEEQVERIGKWIEKNLLVLDLYLYDHSGITMSTTPFSSRWDSGQVGYIYMTREQARKVTGMKRLTAKGEAKALDYMRADVETYDQWLRGDVYGYTVTDPNGEEVDSCWGYYGTEAAIAGARESIEYLSAKYPCGEDADNSHEALSESI